MVCAKLVVLLSFAVTGCESDLPDISGIWSQTRGDWPVDDTPYTVAGQAVQDAWDPDTDPVLKCIHHFGRVITAPFPVEILQTPGRVTFLYENGHEVRRVFMDGRRHPDNEPPTVMGHSTGHWEGTTLVVDTIGIGAGFLRPEGLPNTADIHVTERYTPAGDSMRVSLTVDDPEYYTGPFVVSRDMERSPELEILEYNCIVRGYLYETFSSDGASP